VDELNKNKNTRTINKIIGIILGAGLVFLFYYKADFSWGEVIGDILESGWLILLGSSLFTWVLFYISTVKWQLVLKDLKDNRKKTFSFIHLFHYTSLGFIFSFFLPRAVSDVSIKSLLLKKVYNVQYKTSVYSILIDQFFNLIIAFIFLIPAIALMADINNIRIVLLLNFIGLFLFTVIFYYFSKPVLALLAKLYSLLIRCFQKIRFLKQKENQNVLFANDLDISTETVRKLYFLTLIRQLPMVMRLYVIVLVLGMDIDFYYLLLSCSVMLLFGLVTIIPAQLGIGEWGWYAMLALAGLPDSQIVTFVLSTRIYSNLSILVVFALSWCLNNINFIRRKQFDPGIYPMDSK